MLPRLLNNAVLAAEHRVVFDTTSGAARYSTPFELFLDPGYVIDCAELLSSSWHHFPGGGAHIASACTPTESALAASCAFSQGLVSVNKSN